MKTLSSDPVLSEKEAFLAMYAFLDAHYRRSPSDEIGSLLGSLSLLEDGQPADAAFLEDWRRAVENAKRGRVEASLRFKGDG